MQLLQVASSNEINSTEGVYMFSPLNDSGFEKQYIGVRSRENRVISDEQLTRVHTAEHVDAIEAFCASGGGMIGLDTVAVEASYEAALRAAGGAAHATRALIDSGSDSGVRAAFCALRPPGHHAETATAMGFCL